MIDAETVIEAIFAGGYADRSEWKNKKATGDYTFRFPCKKCALTGWHTFVIEVHNGDHFISEHSVFYFCQKHHIALNLNTDKS